jgi:hypothetical protein
VELLDVRQEPSPLGAGRLRLLGRVAYAGEPRAVETLWFDLPAACASPRSAPGDGWLACLLPLAVALGEPLRISQPVDPRLRDNAERLVGIWRRWEPGRAAIRIEARAAPDPAAAPPGAGSALLFSGGVDSFFSALQLGPEVGLLVGVGGFDVPLRKAAELVRLEERLARAARELGRPFAFVHTNLRETRFRRADWERLAHGAALAAVGHFCAGTCSRIAISSGNDHASLEAFGSHPQTDPLFSSSRLEVVHHGADWTRAEKLAEVAKSDVAARHLRVCWRARSAENCGRCRKCWCTMLQLHLLGALARFASLPGDGFDPRAAARVDSRRPEVRSYLEALRAHAVRTGQEAAARALERGFRRSDRLAALARAAPWLDRPGLARLLGLEAR